MLRVFSPIGFDLIFAPNTRSESRIRRDAMLRVFSPIGFDLIFEISTIKNLVIPFAYFESLKWPMLQKLIVRQQKK
jgi:hypothetical protein